MRLACLLLPLLTALPFAATAFEGTSFLHKDWLLVCDNTGTCRAAGYQQEDGDSYPVSLFLERPAGGNAPVQTELALGGDFDRPGEAWMFIGTKALGHILLSHAGIAELSPEQTRALLAAIQGSTPIQFRSHENTIWELSTQGANAVLLKMDEFQRRVGTSSALINPGRTPGNPLPPKAAPVIHAASVSSQPARTISPADAGYDRLYQMLQEATEGECEFPYANAEKKPDLVVKPLNDSQVLVEGHCWMAAYNMGDMAVVMDSRLSQVIQVVGTNLTDSKEGMLFYAHKSRGLGDCWAHGEYVWDGQRFVKSLEKTTGLCRGFPGGAWDMPIFVSEVRRAEK